MQNRRAPRVDNFGFAEEAPARPELKSCAQSVRAGFRCFVLVYLPFKMQETGRAQRLSEHVLPWRRRRDLNPRGSYPTLLP